MRGILFTIVIMTLAFTGMGFYITKQSQVVLDQKLDAEYVKGFEAALDCRSLMSAPLCEELLKREGEN